MRWLSEAGGGYPSCSLQVIHVQGGGTSPCVPLQSFTCTDASPMGPSSLCALHQNELMVARVRIISLEDGVQHLVAATVRQHFDALRPAASGLCIEGSCSQAFCSGSSPAVSGGANPQPHVPYQQRRSTQISGIYDASAPWSASPQRRVMTLTCVRGSAGSLRAKTGGDLCIRHKPRGPAC